MVHGIFPLLTSVLNVAGGISLFLHQLHVASTCTLNAALRMESGPPFLVVRNFSEFLTTNKSATLSDIFQQLNHSADTNAPTLQAYLDLSRNGLKDFDLPVEKYGFAKSVVTLDVSYNQIETLTDRSLSRFPSLTHVSLAFNALSTLSASVFPPEVSLLDVSGNRLRYVKEGMLGKSLKNFTASRNTISEIMPGALPERLCWLDLSFNDLDFLQNEIFQGLDALEFLNLSHNRLATIQPRVFHTGMASLKTVDLSFNSLTSYEPWPYLFTCKYKPFVVDLKYNNISRFTNSLNMTVLSENKFTKVDLRHNALTHMTLKDLSIYYNGQLPNAFQVDNLELNVADNPWLCDCSMYGLVSAYRQSLVRDLTYVGAYLTCQNPPHLRGRTFGFLIDHPNMLTCRVTDQCPQGCQCLDRPHRGYVEVTCDRNQHLYTGLPSVMPPDVFLFLNLSGHALDFLDPTAPYIGRLYQLDVSANRLLEVTPSFLEQASSLVALNVSHNQLTSLPQQARKLSLQQLQLFGNPLQCSCDFVWFGEWLRVVMANASASENAQQTSLASDAQDGTVAMTTNFPHGLHLLTCVLEADGVLAVVDMTAERLGCRQLAPVVVASVCCLLLLLCAVVACWRKRYELKVWSYFWLWDCCHYKATADVHTGSGNDNRPSIKQFDVYISVDEEDEDAVLWLQQVMLPLLEGGRRPLLVYVPIRQELLGSDKSRARADAILGCRNTLALITPGYAQNGWCRYEFDQACRHLEEENAGKLVLLKMVDRKCPNQRDSNATRDHRLQERTCERNRVKGIDWQEVGAGGRESGLRGLQHPGGNALQEPHGLTPLRPDSGAPKLVGAHPMNGDTDVQRHLSKALVARHSNENPTVTIPVPQGVEVNVKQEPDHRLVRWNYNSDPATTSFTPPNQRTHGHCNFLLRVLCGCAPPCTAGQNRNDNLELSRFCDVTGQPDTLESLNAFLMEGKFISSEDYLWKHKVLYELSTYKKN